MNRHRSILLCARASLLWVLACRRLPDISDLDTVRPDPEPFCYEGHDGTVAVWFCEVTDGNLLQNLRAGRWLPPRARILRARSPLRYGNDDTAADRASMLAKQHDSYIFPHYDTKHRIAGWDLYDRDARLAMLSLDLDDRWGLVFAETNAVNGHMVRTSLQRFLDAPDPIASRARTLFPP
jgi:hypothetical protein